MFFGKKDHKDESSSTRAKVVAVINQKGGVGKTTMAFNLAHALAKGGNKVLCMDLDPQSNLTLLCGLNGCEGKNIFQLMINSIRELKPLHIPLLVSEVIKKGKVDILPAGQDLSGFELTVAGISSPRQLILSNFAKKSGILEQYDYVIIDCPPTLGLLVVNILCLAQGVVVPFRPDDFSGKGVKQFFQVLEDVDDMGIVKAPTILAHIPNLVDGRRKQELSDLATISEELRTLGRGAKIVEPFYNRAGLVKSLSQKKSVFDYNSSEFVSLQQQFSNLSDIVEEWADGQSN